MQQTGEAFCDAKRNTETLSHIPINVIELGDDGGEWFIEGTTEIPEALEAVKKWINQVYSAPDDTWREETLDQLQDAIFTVRSDWYWQPITPEHPYSDVYLRNRSKNPQEYNNEKPFAGVHIKY